MKFVQGVCCASALVLLQACSSTARFDAVQPGTRLTVGDLAPVELPHTYDLGAKATGQHEFRVETPDGKSMYGILPLKVNGGRMAVSILFFAPALAMGGFRDAYANYKFDVERGEVLFQTGEGRDWRVHRVSEQESIRARARFGDCLKRDGGADGCAGLENKR